MKNEICLTLIYHFLKNFFISLLDDQLVCLFLGLGHWFARKLILLGQKFLRVHKKTWIVRWRVGNGHCQYSTETCLIQKVVGENLRPEKVGVWTPDWIVYFKFLYHNHLFFIINISREYLTFYHSLTAAVPVSCDSIFPKINCNMARRKAAYVCDTPKCVDLISARVKTTTDKKHCILQMHLCHDKTQIFFDFLD